MIKNDENKNIISQWFKNNIVSIGFSEIGNPKDYDTKDKLLVRCDEVYSNEAPIFRIRIESQLWKFSREIDIGDQIITYSRADKAYYFGSVKNNYVFLPEVSKNSPNIIKVEWSSGSIPEANITKEIKNSLNAPSMVYQIANNELQMEKTFSDEALSRLEKEVTTIALDLTEQVYLNCENTIKNLQSNEMLKIVDEVFRLNGYIFRSMEEKENMYHIDVIYMDPFKMMKFANKISIVKGIRKIKTNEIENAIKDNNENYKLILFSVGGFESSSKNNAQINKICSLVDLRDLVKLIFKNYDKFSDGLKHTLNLKKVYI